MTSKKISVIKQTSKQNHIETWQPCFENKWISRLEIPAPTSLNAELDNYTKKIYHYWQVSTHASITFLVSRFNVNTNCVKSIEIHIFCCSPFPNIWTEYRDLIWCSTLSLIMMEIRQTYCQCLVIFRLWDIFHHYAWQNVCVPAVP